MDHQQRNLGAEWGGGLQTAKGPEPDTVTEFRSHRKPSKALHAKPPGPKPQNPEVPPRKSILEGTSSRFKELSWF